MKSISSRMDILRRDQYPLFLETIRIVIHQISIRTELLFNQSQEIKLKINFRKYKMGSTKSKFEDSKLEYNRIRKKVENTFLSKPFYFFGELNTNH
jgi:hypothetical protein